MVSRLRRWLRSRLSRDRRAWLYRAGTALAVAASLMGWISEDQSTGLAGLLAALLGVTAAAHTPTRRQRARRR
jgi:hypothetical protein